MEKRLMTFIACLFLSIGMALAQTQVSGTVTSSEDGSPVIGASIKVVGTNTGTVTNIDGNFSLNVSANAKLEVSYIGMVTKTVKAAKNMKIVLDPDNHALDEVMVVAYGTQKKSAFTGSAAIVDAKEIGKVQVTNAVDALKGKAAGVQIYTGSGQPGATPTIRIRGFNSKSAGNDPLIVLDGSPFSGSLNDINPADVESMTVLKDASSTALYGARGGNGVILITTKSGQKGTKGTLTVDAKWGSNSKAVPEYETMKSPAKYYEMWYKALNNYAQNVNHMDATQAWKWANDNMITNTSYGLGYNVYTIPEGQQLIGTNGKLNPNATLGSYSTMNGTTYYLTPDDWIDEIYNNSLRQEYTVTATGASDRGTFYGSANYLSNDGITAASNYRRFTSRLKADYQVNKWLKVGANMSYGHFNSNSLSESGDNGSIFATVNIAPIYPMYMRDANGNIIYDQNSRMIAYDYGSGKVAPFRPFMGGGNPISDAKLNTDNTEGNTFNGTGFAEIQLPYGFKFTSINNVYLNESRSTSTSNPYFGQYAASNGVVNKEHDRTWSYNYQQRINWHQVYGKHDIEVMLGHEYYRVYGYGLYASKHNQFSVDNKELAGAVVLDRGTSSMSEYNTESWLSRAMYNYDSRYFGSVSVMRQASSRFAKDNWLTNG
jgi:TonB-linked SusC/RagA family outer membrane protein